MQDMKLSTFAKICLVIAGAAFLVFVLVLTDTTTRTDDLPGEVIGPNPQNIPESKLPICNFTGAEFVEEPCYSPPGSMYL